MNGHLLAATRLRYMKPSDAVEDLTRLNGIGPFAAELIVVRGAGAPDYFPTSERRLHDSMAQLYETPDTSLAQLEQIASGWSPYRSWVSVLIRTHREDITGEIAGTRRAVARPGEKRPAPQ